jgi:hypothetical protein
MDSPTLTQPTRQRANQALLYERRCGDATNPVAKGVYQRHEPQNTVLYHVVEEHLNTLLLDAQLRSEHGYGYPQFIEKTFRTYIDCGRIELGFCRVVCLSCKYERIRAFSCKCRGVCPSCDARRMNDTAAHLVDRVLPMAPYRQFVLTFPVPLRLLLLRDPKLVSFALQTFTRRIFAWQRRIARSMGIKDPQCGAVTFIQRWGSALNSNHHFHSVIPDGVFEQTADDTVRFVPILGPDDEDVKRILEQVRKRIDAKVEHLTEDIDPDTDEGGPHTLELALAPGPRRRPDDGWEHPQAEKELCCHLDGYSLHAATTVDAEDRAGLERLCRYGLRASFSLNRLSLLPNGDVQYRLKRAWSDGRTDIVLPPLSFLRRLAALIPPKRIHTVRYHGVFSPASLLRPHVLPRFERPKPAAPCDPPPCPTDDSAPPHAATIALAALAAGVSTNLTSPVTSEDHTSEPSTSTVEHVVPLSLIGTPLDESDLMPIRPRRLDWASLLQRVYDVDVLKCPRCDGRLEVIAAISDPDTLRRILDHLGLPSTPPECKPARGPPEDLHLFDN